jgi:uncharacterized protein (TIGR03000 family)
MYSIVLLTALSAPPDVAPAPAPHAVAPAAPVVMGGCYGSVATGCYGSCYGSGSCSGGCYGSCHGGFFRRSGGGFLGHKSSCHGCSGGYACSGFSCFGSWRGSCHGGCYGSCSGGCYGSSWGPAVGMPPYTLHGYNNLTNPNAVYGNVYYPNQPPVMTVPVAPMVKPTGSDSQPMGANLRFKVPADAKLYVDGKLAPGSGPERAFYTPPLEAGKKFYYEVKAEVTVNGKTLTEEKKVIVEAGANLTEEFPKLVAAVEKPDTVAGK